MPGKTRPSLRAKTLSNVDLSNLSITDKKCIHEVFEKFETLINNHSENITYCKDCMWATERIKDNELFKYQCRNTTACGKPRRESDFCSYGNPK